MDTSRKSIYGLMLELVKIPSVSPGPGETRLAELIYDKLTVLPYFKTHKDHLEFIPIPDDPFGRKAIFAIVKAEPMTDRTIILTSHLDVVDTSESKALSGLAFHPEEYTKRITELNLPQEAAEDLESGKYIFGRGVMDMKCGLAIQMALLSEYSRDPMGLPVNIALLVVGDEENNSAGMRAAVTYLANLREKGMDFVACVNSEGIIPKYPGDKNRYIDVGTVGKIMPFFYCVGRESHVGQYYAGLNANLMSSAVTMLLEGNPDWAETWKGEVYPPPASLKQKDLRDIYSVTLPARSAVYFNHLTITSTPGEILEKMKDIASKAFDTAIEHVTASANEFSQRSGTPAPITWERNVMIKGLPHDTDERERSLLAIGETLKFYHDKRPMIIVGFLLPYYPHRTNRRQSAREKGLIEAVNRVIEKAHNKFNEPLAISENFASISDLSYVGFQGTREELVPLAHNTPGWGVVYNIPLDDLLKLDIPAVNLGPAGKDAHKFMERLELDYSLEVVPHLLKSLLEKLADLE